MSNINNSNEKLCYFCTLKVAKLIPKHYFETTSQQKVNAINQTENGSFSRAPFECRSINGYTFFFNSHPKTSQSIKQQ